jgi:phenylalanyl-tRNA synthetase alpha chain
MTTDGYRLTEEGKEYLEKGLPEKNLVELLNSHPQRSVTLDKAVTRIKNFPVALKWAMEKGWVSKRGNDLILMKLPDTIPEQEALKKISEGKAVDEKLLDVLLQRNLVEKIVTEIEEVKKLIGKEVTNLTPKLIKTGFWRKVKFKPYNVEVVGKKIYGGKRHPYVQFLNEVRRKLVELGFKEMTGPIIETEFWNFDALWQPQDHPARDWFSTFRLKYPEYGNLPKELVKKVKKAHEVGVAGSIGWRYKWDPRKAMQLMPRAHCTCLSARTLASKPDIPGKYFAIAKCYRPDIIDPTHMVEFNQVEGIVIDESLNFKHLLGILKMFAIEICKAKKVKFSPDYYPFVEPGVQLSATHSELGWMEFGGAGIFREELTEPLNIHVPVIAWGLGIDRLAMFRLGINDIRELFSKNLDWLRKKVVHEYIF